MGSPLELGRTLLDAVDCLGGGGLFIGRAHLPAAACPRGIGGPTPVLVSPEGVFDLSALAPTTAALLASADLPDLLRGQRGGRIASVEDALTASQHDRRGTDTVHFLSPIDLQPVKACGVTFAASLLERLIEEQARGDPAMATKVRATIQRSAGERLQAIKAGTPASLHLLKELRGLGIASAYLEVGLGPYVEVFTKAPVLGTVGTGERVHVRDDSEWSNPEPEIVLVVSPDGTIVGATLGNDVNLRDLEGRSPLLLGIAKDNTASASVGPWIRLFDVHFTLDLLMASTLTMTISGEDGFAFEDDCPMDRISRLPDDLVRQASGRFHGYPDGFSLFLGTMVVPTADRVAPGLGFTHRPGDVVAIRHPHLGCLVNQVASTADIPPWDDGIGRLMTNLGRRGLLQEGSSLSASASVQGPAR